MNNKLMLFVEIPLLETELNILVPLNKKIGNIVELLVNYINTNITEETVLKDNLSLYDKLTGKIISNNTFVKNSNLKNGQVLILI